MDSPKKKNYKNIVIIIGFNYFNDVSLPGTLIDLYRVYNYFKKGPNKIIIITDIQKNPNPNILIHSIIHLEIVPNILSFIDDIKKRNEYYYFINRNKLLEHLFKLISDETRIVIYYSGHSCQNGFILPCYTPTVTMIDPPKQEYLYTHDIEELILMSNKLSQILIVNDSCFNFNFNLPFIINENGSRFISSNKIYRQQIICINSSTFNNTSFSTVDGSIFTYNLINILSTLNISFKNILQRLNKGNLPENDQSLIYTSYPNIYYIWYWVLNKKLNIYFNPFHVSFEICKT